MPTHEGLEVTSPGLSFPLANSAARQSGDLSGHVGTGDVEAGDGNPSDPYAVGDVFADAATSLPRNVEAVDSASAGAADVTWDAVAGAVSYNVYVDASPTEDNAAPITDTSYTTTNVGAGSTDITVTAVDEYDHEFGGDNEVTVVIV